jgi:hypothetical protein
MKRVADALILLAFTAAMAVTFKVTDLPPDARSLDSIMLAAYAQQQPAPAQQWPAGTKRVLQNEPGGYIAIYRHRFETLAASGDSVEIRGKCLSACTLVLAYIPKERLCFHETAWLGFHHAALSNGAVNESTMRETQAMFDSYPQDIRTWLQQRGSIEKMPGGVGFWAISSSELWKMGYRKCDE